ncbi:hypothetical protein ALC60_11822 [Trachymyrmex zeteki]|uniref:Uncharacterized protein n=1 Tax=Mycetomoellerius zeteki TaxID=64791 RepID=A0A151WN24_9HYME|nr:hypothetical protein ALC60_11822 [Trachymyrmex zeteki]
MNSFTEVLRGRERRTRFENPQERNNGRLFRKLFSAEHEEEEKEEEEEVVEKEEERVGGHCDCLALTFASHILPGCQWHSTDEFLVIISDFCSRTETRYYPAEFRFGCFRRVKMYVRTTETLIMDTRSLLLVEITV